MPAFLRLALDENLRTLNGVFLIARGIHKFFAPLRSLFFDDRCAEEAGQIRADLAARGQPIGPNDLLIAATARAHNAILVTHNIREFSRVTNLNLEDWEEEYS